MGAVQLCPPEIGVPEICIREVCSPQVGPHEYTFVEPCTGQVPVAQVSATQIAASLIDPNPVRVGLETTRPVRVDIAGRSLQMSPPKVVHLPVVTAQSRAQIG